MTGWKPGDRVIATTGSGGLVEKVALDATSLFRLPEGRSFAEGASLLMTYGTTIHALVDRGHLAEGRPLLVLGAAGGVGLAAVELGKAFGARVVAAVSSEEKAAAARQAGADDVARLSHARPSTRTSRKALADAVQGGGRPQRRRRDLRSGRRRLCRAGAALDRAGRAAISWSASPPASPGCRST